MRENIYEIMMSLAVSVGFLGLTLHYSYVNTDSLWMLLMGMVCLVMGFHELHRNLSRLFDLYE